MTTCPICKVPCPYMLPDNMYVSTAALYILRRTHPSWSRADGICLRCHEAAEETAHELEKVQNEEERFAETQEGED